MTTVAAHDQSHLAAVYLWMAGGIEQALATGASDVAGPGCGDGLAVGLGAGMPVHDILHEREGRAWQMRVSSYRKLRLSPAMLTAALEATRLNGTISQGPRGLLRLAARREVRS